MSKVVITQAGHWLWRGAGGKTGTIFKLYGVAMTAQRASWSLFVDSDLPRGVSVISCVGDKRCVNPGHLSVGDRHDAAMTAIDRGGYSGRNVARGANASQAKLTNRSVAEIRQRYVAGASRAELADAYQVSWTAIDNIVAGRTWTVPE